MTTLQIAKKSVPKGSKIISVDLQQGNPKSKVVAVKRDNLVVVYEYNGQKFRTILSTRPGRKSL